MGTENFSQLDLNTELGYLRAIRAYELSVREWDVIQQIDFRIELEKVLFQEDNQANFSRFYWYVRDSLKEVIG